MYVPMINHRSDDFVELYEDCVEKTKKVFMTEGEAVCLSASGTGAVEASVVNLIKKGDKVIIPVNGEFSSRLSQMLEWAGASVIKLETQPGENASFESVKEAFDNNKDVKAFYCVWNETSTGTMINYLDKVKDLTSRNDSYYVVDGVSIVGGEELKVDKWGIDIAMTGAWHEDNTSRTPLTASIGAMLRKGLDGQTTTACRERSLSASINTELGCAVSST